MGPDAGAWVASAAIWIIALGFGYAATALKSMKAEVAENNAALQRRTEELQSQLSDTRDTYARRDDIRRAADRLECSITELRDESRSNHRKVMTLVAIALTEQEPK